MVSQILQARTRRQLRESVGYNVLGSDFIVSTFTSNGTTTTASDTTLLGGDENYAGGYMIPRSGTDDGTIVRVSAFDETGGALEQLLTFSPAVNTDSVQSGDAYELWPDRFDPRMLHSFMDDAILDVTGRVFDPEEDISLHLHPDELRYDIPSQFAMVTPLQQRVSVRTLLLEACDAVWGTIDTDVTATVDSEVRRRGSALKLVIATGVIAGDDLATETITTSDISKYTHLEFWIRSTVTLSAGDLNIILSDSGGTEETLSVPAVASADTWTFMRIALASPENDTEITTIAIDYTVDKGASTLWVDQFFVVDNESAVWARINPNRYLIETQSRDIVFKQAPDYGLLKIIGGDKPVLFTTETTASEVDDWFIVCFTTAAILGSPAFNDGSTNASRRLALWEGRTERAKGSFPPLVNVRKLS